VFHPTRGRVLVPVDEGRVFELNNIYPHEVSNDGCANPRFVVDVRNAAELGL
jgi:hypothetical protein